MKKFLIYLYSVFESIGKARAASHYTRMGNYKMAKKIMSE